MLFPNPNDGIFNIDNASSRKISKVFVNRIDIGKLVFFNDYNFQDTIIVDISREKSGVFTVQVFLEDGDFEIFKIIKK
ncbi:MAG: T9SS type A sorting domain-containing protein [Flavobacterium sp.]|nr:T9SS type A sorting domain-containing protein [Flavobacterium sp.]